MKCVNRFKNRWVDGHCRHICLLCPYKQLCNELDDYYYSKEKDMTGIIVRYKADIIPIETKDGSDWIDLRCAKTMELKAGNFYIIPLGVVIKLPKGYEGHLAPRSSTFKNYGIIQTNSVGVIDESYCGIDDEWGMPVYATRDTTIYKDDRICQFRIVQKMGNINIVTALDDTPFTRNRGGFGSTGVK